VTGTASVRPTKGRMDLWQTLERRTTIRRFADRPVDSAIVRKAVRAALHAPAYNHLWEWAFLRIRDADLRVRLADAFGIHDLSDPAALHVLFDSRPEEARRIYLRALPLQRTMLLSAPTLLMPVYRPKRGETGVTGPVDLNAHASIWMGIAYLLLSLTEDGVGGCTLVPNGSQEGKRLLGVPDDKCRVPLVAARRSPKRLRHWAEPVGIVVRRAVSRTRH
jgi:nitroreductase